MPDQAVAAPTAASASADGGTPASQRADAGTLLRDASRDALLTLVEHAPDVIARVDLELRHLYINRRVEEVTGRPVSDFLGRTHEEMGMPADFVRLWREASEEVFRTGAGTTIEFEYDAVDGARRFQSRVAPEFDEDGRIVSLLAVTRDITRERTAIEQSRMAEARHARLFNVTAQGVIHHDAGGRITDVNPAAERILGLTADEMHGRHCADVMELPLREDGAPIPLAEHPAAVALATRSEVCDVVIGVFNGVRGEHRWILLNAHPEFDAGGAVSGLFCTFADITEQRTARCQLEEANGRLRTVLDMSPIAIVMVDPDRRVRLWNRAAESLFGWSADEVLGRPYPIAAPLDEHARPEEIFDACATGQSYHGAQIRRLARDGEVRELRFWNSNLLDSTGRVYGMVGIFVDQTGRNRLEAELRQAQKLEAIGRLAGGVAHDFNNVLTSILGHADLMGDAVDARHPLREDLDEIRRSAERARSLTRQLLAFSRKQVLSPEVLDVGAVIADMRRMLDRLIGEDVTVVAETAPDLWPIRADRGQVEQVLLNLAVNSRDALPHGGSVAFRACNIARNDAGTPDHCVPRGDWVLLEVADNGTGIDAALLERIFEPFFTTKPSGKGTGLGLAMVYGVVMQSGGHVRVDSEPGRGTTFRIYLPRCVDGIIDTDVAAAAPAAAGDTLLAAAAHATAAADATIAPEPSRASPRSGAALRGDAAGRGDEDTQAATVLLVEDEPAVRSLAARILARDGYRVLVACEGEEALDVADRHAGEIDIVVSDVVMPGMSGRELVDRLQATYPALGVLLMSGYSDELLTERGGLRATEEFLEKPFTVTSLSSAVRRIIERRLTIIG